METDPNLLFGVLALQADLLDPDRFARACSDWAARKNTPLSELLVERGWLTVADRADVEKLLDRKLRKHGGDAQAGLAEVTGDSVRQSLADIADADVRQSLAGSTPPPLGHVLVSTTTHIPEAWERYTLSRLHATGGIGRVWRARDDSLGRDVTLTGSDATYPLVSRCPITRCGSIVSSLDLSAVMSVAPTRNGCVT